MRKQLLIVGAGGFGREVLAWALEVPPEVCDWNIGGFLDSNPHALTNFNTSFQILGDPLSHAPSENEVFVCAIGNPKTKLGVCRGLTSRGGQFVSLKHPNAVIGPDCTIGQGVILCPGAVLTTNVNLGHFVTLNVHATVGHDVEIGDGSTLSGHADVTGGAKLGEGVFLGSHATVLPNIHVGDYAVVGAGSVVLRRVQPSTTVMGVPAKQIYGFKAKTDE